MKEKEQRIYTIQKQDLLDILMGRRNILPAQFPQDAECTGIYWDYQKDQILLGVRSTVFPTISSPIAVKTIETGS